MKKAFLAASLALVSGTTWAQSIAVTVNGNAVAFPKQGPLQAPDGSILVPLREVFESLGAAVQFLPQTRTITASRGNTNISLQLGESVGFVNGKPKSLTTPAQNIAGTTMLPLRFLSEAFGAEVKWDANARLVAITLAGAKPVVKTGVGAVKLPPAEEKPIIIPVKGLTPDEIKAVNPTAPVILPKTEGLAGVLTAISATELTVKSATGIPETLALAPDAIVLVKVGTAPQVRQELSALKSGDAVQIKRNSQGQAFVIEASYDERIGTIKSLEALGDRWIALFTEGPPAEVETQADVQRLSKPSSLSEVRPGERVSLRINPVTHRAVALAVLEVEKPVTAKVEVLKVSHNANQKWVKAGDTITFSVAGTAAAKGTLRVPGLPGAEALPLVETTPGNYVANLTVPAGTSLKDATGLATLTLDSLSSPTVASAETFAIDAVGPTLGTFTPTEGSEFTDPRPNFTGTYSDQGSGLDAKKVQLVVNGEDVTARAIFTETFFTYQPQADLAPGPILAKLTAHDTAGNETSREWRFTVIPTSLLKSFVALPDDRPLNFGDVLTLKALGAPGSKATFSLGVKVKDQPLKEDSPGVYVGTYTVQKQDVMVAAPVTVTVTDTRGRTATLKAANAITVTAGPPETPIIDQPQEGASVGGSVVLSGRCLPNATIKVTVRYAGKRASILAASGLIGEYSAKADASGRWATEPILLRVPKELTGLVFTAEVSATGTGGKGSGTAIVKFKK
ncbi:copper amine oxidase N-terminal domain-containing protein [Armatimonas sp.]|uniref:copper amine oxidase N-terminal domain-containing protein n=1 Tax=Armatimonas sp. TaxID=1872638 RepID=UPI00286CDF4A|nr:copper amine oxidase N-terminal domain-containing protein [Armatimonas sp.]